METKTKYADTHSSDQDKKKIDSFRKEDLFLSKEDLLNSL